MTVTTLPTQTTKQRDWRLAVRRGALCRCPACGEGRLFSGYLKPVAACDNCGEDLSHQRADDLPPYIVITLVGHIVVGGLLVAEKLADWSMTTNMIIWPALTLILALGLIQPVKGSVIGLQWGLRMHGFEGKQPAARPSP